MKPFTYQRRIFASVEQIRSVLMNVASLAEWNPALRSVSTTDRVAILHQSYGASTVLPGPAKLTYVVTEPTLVAWHLDVVGGREIGKWELTKTDAGTLVEHRMTHRGLLFAALRGNMRNVPELRVDRLASRVADRT